MGRPRSDPEESASESASGASVVSVMAVAISVVGESASESASGASVVSVMAVAISVVGASVGASSQI